MDYLTAWSKTPDAGAAALLDCAQIAIAADKTQNWDSALMAEIRKALAANPLALARLDAFTQLLGGDTAGAAALFATRQNEPGTREATTVIRWLRGFDYPLAADAVEALTRDLTKARLIAWLRIPKEKRGPIDENMLQRYLPSSMNRRALVEIALNLYAAPPPDCGLSAIDFLEFAVWFGKDTGLLTLSPADDLASRRQFQPAILYAQRLAAVYPTDYRLQRVICRFFTECGDRPSAITRYQQLLAADHEPYVREVRLDYLERLRTGFLKPENVTLAGMQQDANPLCAGDALLVEKKYPEAAAQYRKVFQDARAPLPRRLSAWTGLLDNEPAWALEQADALFTALDAAQALPDRAALVVWTGWQLARITEREIPLAYGVREATRLEYIPVPTVEGWTARLSALMDRVVAMDPVACLKTGNVDQPSLRYSAALIHALTGNMKQADAVAKQEVTYMAPPPPGGWFTFPGTPDKDADKPRQQKSPVPGEREQLMAKLTPAVGRFFEAAVKEPTAKIPHSPPNLELIFSLASRVNVVEIPHQRTANIQEFARQFMLAIEYLDPKQRNLSLKNPPPPPREVDFLQVASLRTAINVAFKPDGAAKEAVPFVKEGLQEAMLIASNPRLLSELCGITLLVIDRYGEALQDTKLAEGLAHNVAKWLAIREVYDMRPYVTRLREHYTPPDAE